MCPPKFMRVRYNRRKHGSHCNYCKKLLNGDASIDHVIPRSKGGSNRQHNLVACCIKCNQLKADLDLADFMKILRPVYEQPKIKNRLDWVY